MNSKPQVASVRSRDRDELGVTFACIHGAARHRRCPPPPSPLRARKRRSSMAMRGIKRKWGMRGGAGLADCGGDARALLGRIGGLRSTAARAQVEIVRNDRVEVVHVDDLIHDVEEAGDGI